MQKLGCTALVTGSSAGLGFAIARRLAADGWAVAVNSRSGERAAKAADKLAALTGGKLVPLAGDVSDPDGAAALVAAAISALGHLDLLVNNAGIAAEAPTVSLALEQWRRILATNLTGAVICAREAGAHMIQRGSGAIINVGSLWANLGMPQRAAYAASKHGLHGLTTSLARQWASRGVRVATVHPAYIATAMIASVNGGNHEDLVRRTPMGRLGTPDEVAEAVAFLANSSEVGLMSLKIDGGWMAYGGW